MIFEEDYHLENVPPNLFSRIQVLLDYNESWRKIQILEELYKVIAPPITLAPSKSPSEYILNTLVEKLCTMGNLRDILLKSECYEALAVFYTERIRIIKEPNVELQNRDEIIIKRKTKFALEFICKGVPQPQYQWYKDDEPVPDQTSSKLYYDSYMSQMAGDYYCKAVQTIVDYRTNSQQVHEKESKIITVLTELERCIVTKMPLREITAKVGDPDIILEIICDGYPEPKLEWKHGNAIVLNKKNKLKIPATKEQTGVYRCTISNGVNELLVITTLKIIDPYANFPICLEPAIEKVALLIGNEAYRHQEKLSTPMNDTKALQKKLESIGFLALNVNNLTLNGMINAVNTFFREMCCENSIALLYYAGHGFEFGEKFLMPIDVPDSNHFRMKDCMSEYMIFKAILSKNPKLFIALFDMCLSLPKPEQNPGIFEEVRQVHEFECNRNLLRGYATTTGYSSFEVKNIKHSVYNCMLQEYITTKAPILQILRAINNPLRENGLSELHEILTVAQFLHSLKYKLINISFYHLKTKWRRAISRTTRDFTLNFISEFEEHAKTRIAKQMPTINDNLTKDYYIDVEKIGYPPAKQIVDKLQGAKSRMMPNIQGN